MSVALEFQSVLAEERRLVQACAWCEAEHDILDRSDASKSHGICRRHLVEWLKGLPQKDVDEAVRRIERSREGFAPDLGSAPTKSSFVEGASLDMEPDCLPVSDLSHHGQYS